MSKLPQFSADLIELGEEGVAAMHAGAVTSEHMNASLRVLALASERGQNDALDAACRAALLQEFGSMK